MNALKPATKDVLKWAAEVWGNDLSDWEKLPDWFSNFEAFASLAYAAGAAAKTEQLYTKEQVLAIAQMLADSAMINSPPPQRTPRRENQWSGKK